MKIITRFIILFFLIITSATVVAKQINCKVVAVVDGDTIRCLAKNKTLYKVRLMQIDAPEIKQAYGVKSKQYLSRLIYHKNVLLKTRGKDTYKRTLAEIFLNGQNINKKMVADVWHGHISVMLPIKNILNCKSKPNEKS